jgi:D-alanyl-D-alanine dipeptidase
MGANFDDIREIAYPSKESYYLETGELTQKHIENRKLLRKVMSSQGFWNLSTEWWHFTIGRHKNAVKVYPALYFEPGFEK